MSFAFRRYGEKHPKKLNEPYSQKVFIKDGRSLPTIATRMRHGAHCRGAAQIHHHEFATTVVARADENLAENCTFKMTIPAPDNPVRAVWLTYDRGFDIMKYYDDRAVVTFAQRPEIALHLHPSGLVQAGREG
jgi:hypothetical protein